MNARGRWPSKRLFGYLLFQQTTDQIQRTMLGRRFYQPGINFRLLSKYVYNQCARDTRKCFERRYVTSSIYCSSSHRNNNHNNQSISIERSKGGREKVEKKKLFRPLQQNLTGADKGVYANALKYLKSDLPLSKREDYLHELVVSRRLVNKSQEALPSAIFPLLEYMIQQNTSPLSLVKVIQNIGELNLPSSHNVQERTHLVTVMLDRLAAVSKPVSKPILSSAQQDIPNSDTILNIQHALKRSDTFSRCLLCFRKLQVQNRSLNKKQRQILLGLIDSGFRLHAQQDAKEETSFFNFSNLIYSTGRLGFSWLSLFPSTQQAILDSLRIHGNQSFHSAQQQAMLINGLGELAFPLTKNYYSDIQQIILDWTKQTLQTTIEKSHQFHSSQNEGSNFKQKVNSIQTQAVASVIFGLSEMQCRLQPTLSPDLRKLLIECIQCTIGHMPEYLICTTMYNLGLMGLTWKHLSKDAQLQVSQAVITALNKAQPQPLPLLLSGLVNMKTNVRLMPIEFRRALDNCVFRCFVDGRFIDQVKSQTTGRIIRSLGDINVHWSELSVRTQIAMLQKFRTSFQYFIPREVVMGIRGMGLLGIPPELIHGNELFASMIHAIDRVHRSLNDRDVTTLIVGLSKLNISWFTIPAKTRDGLIRILQHGSGLPSTEKQRDESFYGREDSSMKDASSPTYSSSLISYLLYGLADMDVDWSHLEQSLRDNILQRFLRPHALNILYPQDIARVFWGLGCLDVVWPEDLFHEHFNQQPKIASSSITNNLAKGQEIHPSLLPFDFIPSQLLVQLRMSIPKMQLLDVMQSLQGCRMLGITWTELATSDGSINQLFVQRILKLLPQATIENSINLLYELCCLSFQSDIVLVSDRSAVPHPSDGNEFEEVGSLLDAYETILNQLYTQQQDLTQLKPSFVDKYRTTIAYLATIPEGRDMLERVGWNTISHSLLDPVSAQQDYDVMSSSCHSLTRDVAALLRDELDGSNLLIEDRLIPQASYQATHVDHLGLFTSFDIVIRDRQSKSILAIVELHDQRVRWTSEALHQASTSKVPTTTGTATVTLGKPKKYFGSLPQLLKRQLYRHYLPCVPIFQLEVSGAKYVGRCQDTNENNFGHRQQEQQELASLKAVRDLVRNIRTLLAST